MKNTYRPAGDRPPEGRIVLTPQLPPNDHPFSVPLIMELTLNHDADAGAEGVSLLHGMSGEDGTAVRAFEGLGVIFIIRDKWIVIRGAVKGS
jgi:hypothetical protein